MNIISYNSCINACGDHWLQALDLLEELLRSSLQADVITFSSVITACAKGDEWQRGVDAPNTRGITMHFLDSLLVDGWGLKVHIR